MTTRFLHFCTFIQLLSLRLGHWSMSAMSTHRKSTWPLVPEMTLNRHSVLIQQRKYFRPFVIKLHMWYKLHFSIYWPFRVSRWSHGHHTAIDLNSNCVRIFCHFNCDFFTPRLYLTPMIGATPQWFPTVFGTGKLEWLRYQMVKNCDNVA